jgi:hypothetical protein
VCVCVCGVCVGGSHCFVLWHLDRPDVLDRLEGNVKNMPSRLRFLVKVVCKGCLLNFKREGGLLALSCAHFWGPRLACSQTRGAFCACRVILDGRV